MISLAGGRRGERVDDDHPVHAHADVLEQRAPCRSGTCRRRDGERRRRRCGSCPAPRRRSRGWGRSAAAWKSTEWNIPGLCRGGVALCSVTSTVSPSLARITGPGHGAVEGPGPHLHPGGDLDRRRARVETDLDRGCGARLGAGRQQAARKEGEQRPPSDPPALPEPPPLPLARLPSPCSGERSSRLCLAAPHRCSSTPIACGSIRISPLEREPGRMPGIPRGHPQ